MNKKIKINPILMKDCMVGSRSMKMSWAIFGINLLFMIIVLIMLAVNDEYPIVYYYKSISNIFPVLAVCETAILVLVIPIMTSGSISGERERQTLDIMLTTPIKPIAIVTGKLLSAILTVAMYVISSVPLLAISFILGGVKSQVLFEYIGMVLFLGIYVGSIGIFSSSIRKTSIAATITSIVIIAGIAFFTLLIFFIAEYEYEYGGKNTGDVDFLNLASVLLAFNPFVGFADFMFRGCSSQSIVGIMSDFFSENRMKGFLNGFYSMILPITIVVNLLVSFGFLWLASKKTVVTKNKKRRRRKQRTGME